MNKRIIICSDGTWNTPDDCHPSNVVEMTRAIAPVSPDGKCQTVFYDKGVGAEQRGWWDHITGGAFGCGLDMNIEHAYRFILYNYNKGDEIFFFGFSRGSYTARSTVGLIRKVGLLKKIHDDRFEEAYISYRNKLHPDSEEMKNFRKKYSREIEIKFMGLWDTVGALGIPAGIFTNQERYQFHDVELSRIVQYAYHALAIDEKRKTFSPTLWAPREKPGQIIEQVWFSGVHGDIGGGYKERDISSVTLLWLKEKAESCGLTFDEEYLKKIAKPNPMGMLHNSKTGILFKMSPDYVRPIGKEEGAHESVHPSAVNRYDNYKPPYKPSNLTKYLDNSEHKIAEVK